MRLFVAFAVLASCVPSGAMAVGIQFTDFSDTTGLTINGDAAVASKAGKDVLRLTPATSSVNAGSVFSTERITLRDETSFSTRFRFQIDNNGGGGADGLAFVVQTKANNVGGSGIGFAGVPNSLAIEFDTHYNANTGDPDDSHVGINTDGNIVSRRTATVGTADRKIFSVASDRLDGGSVFTAWIDYDGSTDNLELRLSAPDDTARPTNPLVTDTLDLIDVLGRDEVFVGFTSATASFWSDHDILDWQVSDSFSPSPAPISTAAAISGR